MEILNMEELEDLQAQHKQEEFEVVAKQAEVEAEGQAAFDKQKCHFEAMQLLDRQKQVTTQISRGQKRQAKLVEKMQRAAGRNRERVSTT
jgi:hypothetical protein